jgi:uncharacterized protein YeeX (DUF496 family)
VIQRSDGALVSHSAGSAVEATLTEFVNTPEIIASQFEDWLERLLDQLARFPPAQGRDFEQTAKDAAATYQRSAQQRLGKIEREARETQEAVATTQNRLNEINNEIQAVTNARFDELRQTIESLKTGFEQRLQGYESNLETEREEGLRLRGEQAEAFQAAQSERASTAGERIDTIVNDLEQRSETVMSRLEASQQRVANLVDVVVTSSTAGGFAKEANDQKDEGDTWRMRAIALGFLAVVFAVFAVVYAIAVKVDSSLILAKAAAIVAAAGLAGYAARQSAEHRRREVRARRLALEIAAFGPFSEALQDPEKERDLRATFIDRLFVGEQGLTHSDDTPALTGGDLSLVGQAFDIFRKASK